jgi:hypothetical protein
MTRSQTRDGSSKKFFWFPERFSVPQAYLLILVMGTYPVPKEDQIKRTDRVGAPAAHLPAWPERCLRPADRLDYAIRRLITPVPLEVNSVAATRRVSPSTPRREASRNEALLTDIQAAIGRYLFTEYDLAQPTPDRLTHLLIQLEQPDGRSEAVA